jgi:hypothetical protein
MSRCSDSYSELSNAEDKEKLTGDPGKLRNDRTQEETAKARGS